MTATTLFAEPEVDVKTKTVNGYEVILINTHVGNAVALTVNVEAGGDLDGYSGIPGLAHYWEHWIHGGSKKFPGQSTLFEKNEAIGSQYNAYTADNRIFYHHMVHPDAIEEVAELLGAMMSAPAFDLKVYHKELQTVKQEALEYQKQDFRVLYDAARMYLLPRRHPLAKYGIGTQSNLENMRPRDSKTLFYNNYRPGSLQIIVAGNFDRLVDGSDAPIQEDRILKAIEANFLPPQRPDEVPETRPLKTIEVESIEGDENELRMIELGTDQESYLLHLEFELDESIGPSMLGAIETLTDYLNLPNTGGLVDHLRKEGLATNLMCLVDQVNNRRYLRIFGMLTADGGKQRHKIVKKILSALHEIGSKGLSKDVLEFLIARNIRSYRDVKYDPERTAEQMSKSIRDFPDRQEAFDFEAIYGKVSNDDLRKLIDEGLSFSRLLVDYVGADVEARQKDPIFDRPYRVVAKGENNPEILQEWKQSLAEGGSLPPNGLEVKLGSFQPVFSEAPLNREAAPLRQVGAVDGIDLLLEEVHHDPIGSIAMRLETAPLTLEGSVAFALYLSAFKEREQDFLSQAGALGLLAAVEQTERGILIQTKGNSKAGAETMREVLTRLAAFEPKDEELERARQRLEVSLVQSRDEMSALVAEKATAALLDHFKFTSRETEEALKKLSLPNIRTLSGQAMSSHHITLSFYGDYDETTAKQMASKARELFPGKLHPRMRRLRNNSSVPISELGPINWAPLLGNREADDFGLVRVYQGLSRSPESEALMRVLGARISNEVFAELRIARNLGYIHRARVQDQGESLALHFAGGTSATGSDDEADDSEESEEREILDRDGLSKLLEMPVGWQTVINRVLSPDYPEDKWNDSTKGLGRKERILPITPQMAAHQNLLYFERTADIDYQSKYRKALTEVRPGLLIAAGREIFSPKNPMTQLLVSKERCEAIMKALATR